MNDTIEINVTINGETSTKTISVQEWRNKRDNDFLPCENIVDELLRFNEYYYKTYVEESTISPTIAGVDFSDSLSQLENL